MSRQIELVVISDTHLGTYGCHAAELHQYLKSIKPKTLILNGDFIDIWQFNKNYFPQDHLKVIKRVLSLAAKGTKIIYITGNHDEFLRRFADSTFGNIDIVNKKVLELDGKKAWFFHGDVFDASVQHSKWIAKLGGYGYDLLIRINVIVNWFLLKMGKEKYSFSKKIKESVKEAVKYIGDFEKTATDLAIRKGFDYVACGHIHHPQIREIITSFGNVTYLNSGDWVENLTALEYDNSQWKIFTYQDSELPEISNNKSTENEENIELIEVNELMKDVISGLN